MKVYAGGWPSHDTGVAREGGVVHSSQAHLAGSFRGGTRCGAGWNPKTKTGEKLFSHLFVGSGRSTGMAQELNRMT